MLTRNRRVLVSVLDWGLGHATRTSVIVGRLRERGCEVILAGSGRSLELLGADYPELERVWLPGFSPRLSSGRRQWWKIGLQVPWFLWCVWRERRMTERIVRERGVELIVSDNRYGVRSVGCGSVIVTHQLRPKIGVRGLGWLERFVGWVIRRWVCRFDGCLVPDVRVGGLSGELSGGRWEGMRVHGVGLLSRVALSEATEEGEVEWLGIVSGPEPQRGMLERELVERFCGESGRRVVVCGRGVGMGEDGVVEGGVERVCQADGGRLKGLIMSARHIVCRAGYSTIMDLVALGREAELIATPGQGEQEYLVKRMGEIWGERE